MHFEAISGNGLPHSQHIRTVQEGAMVETLLSLAESLSRVRLHWVLLTGELEVAEEM